MTTCKNEWFLARKRSLMSWFVTQTLCQTCQLLRNVSEEQLLLHESSLGFRDTPKSGGQDDNNKYRVAKNPNLLIDQMSFKTPCKCSEVFLATASWILFLFWPGRRRCLNSCWLITGFQAERLCPTIGVPNFRKKLSDWTGHYICILYNFS